MVLIEFLRSLLERVSNIDDLDSGAPLRPDFKAFAGIAGTYRGIFETRSREPGPSNQAPSYATDLRDAILVSAFPRCDPPHTAL